MKTKELIAELRHTAETMQILGDFAKADLLTRAADYIEGNHLQRGEWVRDTSSNFYHRYNCTACNYRLLGEPTNYCPNCGVHMCGEKSE